MKQEDPAARLGIPAHQGREEVNPAQKKALIAALIAALAALGVTIPIATDSGGRPVPPVPPVATSTPAPADGCATPAGMTGLRDQDPEDSQRPWRRTPGQKAVISVDTSRVKGTPEWVEYLRHGAEFWNVSPCVDVRLVDGCPPNAGCVTFEVVSKGDDGNFDERDRDGFNYGGKITVNGKLKGRRIDLAQPIGSRPCSERLNVVIHELGHASGLRHVKTRKVIMDPETYPDVCGTAGRPDQGALDNLAYSYTALQR